MNLRLLLAIPETDAEVVGQARAVLDESDVADSVHIVTTSAEVSGVVREDDIDVVVLHEHIGPTAVLDLARELNRLHPDLALVLLAQDSTPELMRSAMFAGVHVVQPGVLDRVPPSRASSIIDAYVEAIGEGTTVCGNEFDGYWSDVGTLERYERVQQDAAAGLIDLKARLRSGEPFP
jgi:DNA-binding NarL/FixJ family response regulator